MGVLKAMEEFASIASNARDLLVNGNSWDEISGQLCELMDRNFDLRREILGEEVIGQANINMVRIVRSFGMACKFTGSGGALVCLPKPNTHVNILDLQKEAAVNNITFVKLIPTQVTYPFLFQNKQ